MRPFLHSARTTRLALVAALGALGACSDPSTATPDVPDAAFARSTGARVTSLTVGISGLPSGTAAGVRVTGSNGYNTTVNATTTLTGLANGTYTVSATNLSVGGTTYAPSLASQSVNLKSGSSRTLSISYGVVATTGTLTVNVSMPDATPAAVTVTGPNSYSTTLNSTRSLTALAPGSYTIAAATVTSATGIIYAPAPLTQTASITAGVTTAAAVSYTASGVVPGGNLNVQVLAATLTQAVQKLDNSVTLIAGRDAMLRVFPVANSTNTVKPVVRVNVYGNGVLRTTLTATTSGTSVPTAINQGSMAASWNVLVPAVYVQAGLGIQAVVDPDNAITESNESDNVYPATGVPLPLTVRTVNPLNLTFVPVTTSSNSVTGNVSASNAEAFLQGTRDMLPVGAVSYTIRAPYTTSNTLLSDGAGWVPLLNELDALRVAESGRNYYGVAKVGYSSGVAGYGYIGRGTSVGWDYLPSGSGILAHELGHNFSRNHAPCGGVSGADANYPYAGGQIGVFGYNVRTNALQASTTADLMGYCNPSWISDYNFNAMMTFRGFAASALVATTGSTFEQPSLLVWGRVESNGELVLEPALRLSARSVLPTTGGDYTVAAYDDNGSAMFTFDFTPVEVANDGAEGGAHFAFVVPMNDVAYERLSRLELMGNGRSTERMSRQPASAAAAAARGLDVAAEATSRARLRWNANAFPMIMVRDTNSGEILSFARGGDMRIDTSRPELEVVVSDGVKSQSARVRVRGR
ncbi:hypothetical protein [Gemmatimonas phototrophica]|uniref:hypothetical protein n=1 Tax=Gemmatimonas phototrophica TaxID=1379270 RepID=UPI0006A6C9E9|nr:hypothetical protein [Gemmatimonas phototrophica]